MLTSDTTLGSILRNLRHTNGWTLKQMSEKCGIPLSTLSKIEHDRLTLTYDKLLQVSQRLGLRMSELFAEDGQEDRPAVMARRSVGDLEHAVRVDTPNYEYYYLCTELRQKRMIPVITRIRAKSAQEFGSLVKHDGEEYVYVLKGQIIVHTEFYDPVTLAEGQSIYIDAKMGHAYLAAESCDEAEVLGIMSSPDDELMKSLLSIHEQQKKLSKS